MSASKRHGGPVTGKQAERCAFCDHMRRFHRNPADGVHVCSACKSPASCWHKFVEKAS
jgi:hypothetical protein